jgi:hypothetical protein
MKNSLILKLSNNEVANILNNHFIIKEIIPRNKYTKMIINKSADGSQFTCELFSEEEQDVFKPNKTKNETKPKTTLKTTLGRLIRMNDEAKTD